MLIWAIPVAQALINQSWIYSPLGYLDPWYYLGYGLNYADPAFLNDYYKISRLPWILVQYIVRSIAEGAVASWILQIGTLTLASGSLYLLFLRTIGRPAAFVGAAFFAAYTFGHASGGADYHNALAGPLFALTWWLTVRSAQEKWSATNLLVVGACGGLVIHSNIVFINVLPILAVHYVVAFKASHRRLPPFGKSAIWGVGGALLVTLALGAINWMVGRDFLFFAPQFKLASSFVADSSQQKAWWNSWQSGWYWKWPHVYLGPLAAGLAIAAAVLVAVSKMRRPLSDQQQHIFVFGAAYLFAGSLWLMWQTLGHTALDWAYFAYPLVYPLTAAIAAAAALWLRVPSGILYGSLWRVVVVELFLAPLYFYDTSAASAYHLHVSFLVPFAVVGLSLAFLILSGKHYWGGLAFVGLMGIGMTFGIVRDENARSSFTRDSCPSARLAASMLEQGHRLLRAQGFPHTRVFIWSDQDETLPVGAGCTGASATIRLGYFGSALVSTGFNYVQAPWDAKKQDDIKGSRLAELSAMRGLIVHVTNDETHVQQLVERFKENGGVLEPRGRHVLESGSLRVPIYLLEIKPKEARS